MKEWTDCVTDCLLIALTKALLIIKSDFLFEWNMLVRKFNSVIIFSLFDVGSFAIVIIKCESDMLSNWDFFVKLLIILWIRHGQH